MFKIMGKTMQITRGDTGFFEITPMNGDEVYTLTGNDSLAFTVKENTRTEDVLISKVLRPADLAEGGRAVFKILPEDTKALRYKEYVYDVQLSFNGGEIINTIITPSPFIVTDEVT